MTTKEMIEKYNSTLDKIDNYYKNSIVYKRSLTASEKDEIVNLQIQAQDLKEKIQKAKEEARNGATVVIDGEIEKRGNKQMKTEIEVRKQIAEELLNGETIEARATDTTTSQANTVPTLLYSDIVRKVLEQSNVVAEVPRVQGKGKMDFLVQKEEIKAKMLGETEELTEDNLKDFDKVTLDDKRMGTMVLVSKKLLNNSPIVGVEYVTETISKRIAKKIEEQIFKGDGAGNNYTGGILHVFRGGQAGALETDVVGTWTIDDVKKLVLDLNPSLLEGSKLYMNREMFKIVSMFTDNDGRFFLTHDFINDKPVYKILGLPVEVTPEVENETIVLGNIKQGMKLKMAEDMEITVFTEKYRTAGSIGVMAEFYGDASVLDKEAFRVMRTRQ